MSISCKSCWLWEKKSSGKHALESHDGRGPNQHKGTTEQRFNVPKLGSDLPIFAFVPLILCPFAMKKACSSNNFPSREQTQKKRCRKRPAPPDSNRKTITGVPVSASPESSIAPVRVDKTRQSRRNAPLRPTLPRCEAVDCIWRCGRCAMPNRF